MRASSSTATFLILGVVGCHASPATQRDTSLGDAAIANTPLVQRLRSADAEVVQEALALVRADLASSGRVAPEVVTEVASALGRLCEQPKREEGEVRRIACQILGDAGSGSAIAVLLVALNDPYLRVVIPPVPRGRPLQRLYCVWLDADTALRKITAASPIPQPSHQGVLFKGQQESVRDAWLRWHAESPPQ